MKNSRTDDSDQILIHAIAAGDHPAFEQLVQRYRNSVFNFIYRFTGDRFAAEDLAQEVFLRVYRAAGGFETRGKVSSWLFKIARNVCLDETRRRSRLESVLEPLSSMESTPTATPDQENRLHEQELMQALTTLPEKQRTALLLRVMEGFSYAEIAEVLSVSPVAVESLIFRARTWLREKICSKASKTRKDKNLQGKEHEM